MSLPVLRVQGARPYPPRISKFTEPFWQALSQGRFITTRGRVSQRLTFPPKPFCPFSWEREIEWVELSGRGVLYSYTVVHVAPAAFAHLTPYRLCIVDLTEGIRVAAQLLGEGAARLGEPVETVVLLYDDGPLFGFCQKNTLLHEACNASFCKSETFLREEEI